MLNIINNKGNASQNHNEITPIRMATIKKQSTRCFGENMEKLETLCTISENVK